MYSNANTTNQNIIEIAMESNYYPTYDSIYNTNVIISNIIEDEETDIYNNFDNDNEDEINDSEYAEDSLYLPGLDEIAEA